MHGRGLGGGGVGGCTWHSSAWQMMILRMGLANASAMITAAPHEEEAMHLESQMYRRGGGL